MESTSGSENSEVDYTALIVIAGPGGSGRMSLANRYFLNQAPMVEYDPTIEPDCTKIVQIDGSTVRVKAVLLRGQEDFSAMRPRWYGKADAIIFTVDLSNPDQFRHLQFEWDQLRNCRADVDLNCLVLVGCKSDIQDEAMTPAQWRQRIDQMFGTNPEVKFVISSAASGLGVDLAFETAIRHSATAGAYRAGNRSNKCIIQ